MKMECQQKTEKNWNKINNKYILFGLISFIIIPSTSCSRNFCSKLESAIKSQCEKNDTSCTVQFNNAFSFEWDTLYIFDSMLYSEDISSIIGFDYNGEIVPESTRLVFFVKDTKEVKSYYARCDDISFVRMKNQGVVKISRNSVFKVKQKLLNNKLHYYLFDINTKK